MYRFRQRILWMICLFSLFVFAGCRQGHDDQHSQTDLSLTLLNPVPALQNGLQETAELYMRNHDIRIQVIAGSSISEEQLSFLFHASSPLTMAICPKNIPVEFLTQNAEVFQHAQWKTASGNSTNSFPLRLNGRGLLYNKTAIENVIGRPFKASSIDSLENFKILLRELEDKGMDSPILLSTSDADLGKNLLPFLYESQTGSTHGAEQFIQSLQNQEIELLHSGRFQQFLETVDLLAAFSQDPGENPEMLLANGEAAFWLTSADAWQPPRYQKTIQIEYGILPLFMGDNTMDFVNTSLPVSTDLQIIVNTHAEETQKTAAEEFLNWLACTTEGQLCITEKLGLASPFREVEFIPSNPINAALKDYAEMDLAYPPYTLPADMTQAISPMLHSYLKGDLSKEEFAQEIERYFLKPDVNTANARFHMH
ncbi:MAG TPA: extracellular solute-binding protein [Firmicutes bacterium]|nr:extracellular solute-binding protein [Bacillota bacterium]